MLICVGPKITNYIFRNTKMYEFIFYNMQMIGIKFFCQPLTKLKTWYCLTWSSIFFCYKTFYSKSCSNIICLENHWSNKKNKCINFFISSMDVSWRLNLSLWNFFWIFFGRFIKFSQNILEIAIYKIIFFLFLMTTFWQFFFSIKIN